MPDNKTVTFDVVATLVDAFDAAAQDWGWAADQGVGAHPANSKKQYENARNALLGAPETYVSPAAQSAGQEAGLPSWWPDFIQNVCELPDRTSPEDEPEAMVATAEELESCALRAIEEAAEDAARVNGGERSKPTPMFLTGWQLLEALDLIAPDRATDPDQMDEELALQMGDETCHSGAGVYAWEASEPEEGSSFLAGERAADAQQVGGDDRPVFAPLVEPVTVKKAMLAGRKACAVLSGGIGPVAAVHLVNIGVTGWVHTAETAEAYANGFNRGANWMQSALTSPAKAPDGRDFNAWAIQEGLIQDGQGLRYISSQCAIARKAWDAAMLACAAKVGEDERYPALAQLLAAHADELESNAYAYFELAYTRNTDWMAWICSNSRESDPGRKVIARGQGSTPEEACRAANAANQARKGE